MKKEEIAKNIIKKNNFFVIATADHALQPWITPVYYTYDDQFRFYWYSQKNTKHSQLLKKNKKVAIVIFNSQFAESHPAEEGYGVYMTGTASVVAKKYLDHAIAVYVNRLYANNTDQRQKIIERQEDFLGNSPLRMYQFIPTEISLSNTAKIWYGKYLDSRSKVKL